MSRERPVEFPVHPHNVCINMGKEFIEKYRPHRVCCIDDDCCLVIVGLTAVNAAAISCLTASEILTTVPFVSDGEMFPANAACLILSMPVDFPILIRLLPSRLIIFMPLYSPGLCEALIWIPPSYFPFCTIKYTVGVGTMPISTTVAPM